MRISHFAIIIMGIYLSGRFITIGVPIPFLSLIVTIVTAHQLSLTDLFFINFVDSLFFIFQMYHYLSWAVVTFCSQYSMPLWLGVLWIGICILAILPTSLTIIVKSTNKFIPKRLKVNAVGY